MDRYWLNLSRVEGLGWRRLDLLIKYFGDVRKVWEADHREWREVGVNERVVKSFSKVKGRDTDLLALCKKHDVEYVIFGKEDYPLKLMHISSPPIVLYYQGSREIFNDINSIGVVGTRRCSKYGRSQTARFVKLLASRGNVIVSGLASGIDTVAHESCLGVGGRTIAVLAHGLDMTYPSSNGRLRERIVSSGGLVLSEKPIGVKPRPEYFVQRNRIVSGLSDVVLVGEAPQKSGTKITVGFAAEQGKDVYVITGPADYRTYKGSNEIIRDGGMPVSDPEDILVK